MFTVYSERYLKSLTLRMIISTLQNMKNNYLIY